MKFPYAMLRDFVNTELDADAVGDLLTMAGFELEGIEIVEDEPVLDIKVVSNRGDGLSVFGLAREVLAKDAPSTPTPLYTAASSRFAGEPVPQTGPSVMAALAQVALAPSAPGGVNVTIETEDCTRYACVLFENVANGNSPQWMQQRLRQSGQRAISLLVDLTNYVMLELGQPLHAFDLDKLAGPAIVVRKARPGEKLRTLNGDEHELRPDQMMICDAEKPVAAAGIMGGESSEVSASTRRVLLESAHFVNTSVRRTRKQMGLSTEASYRFERSVDPERVVAALERFAHLLKETDGGESRVPGVIDVYPGKVTRQAIQLDVARADMLLGMSISVDEAISYLTKLGFTAAKPEAGTVFSVIPPSWRPDVVREEDLVEELGRVHGYEKIPELLPIGTTVIGGSGGFEEWQERLKEAALRAGFNQTISHSLRDRSPLDDPSSSTIGPRNPASPEMAWLRNSLLPSLADNSRRNGGKDIHLFELGRVFAKSGDGYSETIRFALLSQGGNQPAGWVDKSPSTTDFFSLKGVLEETLEVAGVDFVSTAGNDSRLHPTKQAAVTVEGETAGVIGQIHPDVADEAGLPEDTFIAELLLEPLYRQRHPDPKLKAVSRNPAVRRDMAILMDKSVAFEQVGRAIDDALGPVLEKRWLFDVYEGKGIPEGKHSLAIALQLRKLGENFTDEEANHVREKAVAALVALGGTPR